MQVVGNRPAHWRNKSNLLLDSKSHEARTVLFPQSFPITEFKCLHKASSQLTVENMDKWMGGWVDG